MPEDKENRLLFWFFIGIYTPEPVLRKMEALSSISIVAKLQRFFMKVGEIKYGEEQ